MMRTLRKRRGNFKAENVVNTKNEIRPHLLVFGPGYSAQPFIRKAIDAGWVVSATWRKRERANEIAVQGIKPVEFAQDAFDKHPDLSSVTHVLVSIAPNDDGDPTLLAYGDSLRKLAALRWVGYLSSTNVYGNHDGAWVDETSATKPSLQRGQRRLIAEQDWTKLGEKAGCAIHIFRLAGIYGPGKNAIRSVLDGKAKRIIKPGQVFGRIHRDDIAAALWLAANSSVESNIFNLADDLPAPPQDVIMEAARLLGRAPPEEVPYEKADMSPMGRSFYEENKRVSNQKAKDLLGLRLIYSDYKESLPKLMEQELSAL